MSRPHGRRFGRPATARKHRSSNGRCPASAAFIRIAAVRQFLTPVGLARKTAR